MNGKLLSRISLMLTIARITVYTFSSNQLDLIWYSLRYNLSDSGIYYACCRVQWKNSSCFISCSYLSTLRTCDLYSSKCKPRLLCIRAQLQLQQIILSLLERHIINFSRKPFPLEIMNNSNSDKYEFWHVTWFSGL